MKMRLVIGYVVCTLGLVANLGCGGMSGSQSDTEGVNDGSSVEEPGDGDFLVDGGADSVVATLRTSASTFSRAITPKGGVAPYTMKATSLKRNGIVMPVSTKIIFENGNLVWTIDPTYFGAYDISVEVTDAEGKIGRTTVKVEVDLPANLPAIVTGTDAVLTKIKSLWDLGQLAGNINDWYANRDGRHAPADSIVQALPQIQIEPFTRSNGIEFAPLPNKVVIGNASLAATTGDSWGSLPRISLTYEIYFDAVYKVNRGNNLFWHPEHRDHDEADHFHFNQWFIGISQGSSTTELDEVHHDFYALASFRPEVKTALTERGLLMNVLQMARRRARVASDELYLSGAAHTTVFDNIADTIGYRSNLVDFVNGITADRIPAVAELEVVSETYQAGTGREKMYTGPWLITRIFRGLEYTKKMRLSAQKSYDLNNRPLTYVWKVLRGDPAHVRIIPANANSSIVDLEIDYHASAAIPGGTRPSNRVDVGLFVFNGAYYSSPAMITSFTLNNETRVYDAAGTLVSNTPNTNYVAPYVK